MKRAVHRQGLGVAILLLSMALGWAAEAAIAGPQHWGFGFGYLVTLERSDGGQYALSAYEPPLHVKDGDWRLRWRSRVTVTDPVPGGLATGRFWAETVREDHVLLVEQANARTLRVRTFSVPDHFGPDRWAELGTTTLQLPGEQAEVRAVAAGDPLNLGRDQLVVLLSDAAHDPPERLLFYDSPRQADNGRWALMGSVSPLTFSPPVDLAIGGFWDAQRPLVALLTPRRGDVARTSFWNVQRSRTGKIEATRVAQGVLPQLDDLPSFFVAGDALKDGFAYLFLGSGDDVSAAFEARVAPQLTDTRYTTTWLGPRLTFAGADLRGQAADKGHDVLSAEREAPFGAVVAADIGRVFGYVDADAATRRAQLWDDWARGGEVDVEVAFVKRLPEYPRPIPKEWQKRPWPAEPEEHFGWPSAGEAIKFAVHLKNNGTETIPAESVSLIAWVGAAAPNVDSLPNAAEQISFRTRLSQPLPPFNPEAPNYAVVEIPATWPYQLEQPEGWTWKRLNLRSVGQRWFVVRIHHAADVNGRNDRLEQPYHAQQLRPILPGPEQTAAFPEPPTVAGDPESQDYAIRKLADAVSLLWARSWAQDGADVWQHVASAGYRRGWPAQLDQDELLYAGTPALPLDFAFTDNFVRFNQLDGGGLLTQVGQAFRAIEPVEEAVLRPSATRAVPIDDDRPVQAHVWYWGRGNGGDPYTRWHETLCNVDRMLEGVRYGGDWPWRRTLPAAVNVMLSDRNGAPLENAALEVWGCDASGRAARELSGTTDAVGRWKSGLPRGAALRFDPFDLALRSDDLVTHDAIILTYRVGDYADFAVLGADSDAAHSAYALFSSGVASGEPFTWHVPTLYAADAEPPTFSAAAICVADRVLIDISGQRGRTYRLYRRWAPTYSYELIAERRATAQTEIRFEDRVSGDDWHGTGRQRALYYVTEEGAQGESLPLPITAVAIKQARGLSVAPDNDLLLALNSGTAQPFALLMNGSVPRAELMNHPRPGFQPIKIVQSTRQPELYFVLHADVGDPLSRAFTRMMLGQDGNRLIDPLLVAEVKDVGAGLPQTITLSRSVDEARLPIMVGDIIANGDDPTRQGRITAIAGDQVSTDHQVFERALAAGRTARIFSAAGVQASESVARSLKQPRDLLTFVHDGKEYLAIVDTGHRRVVIWDTLTREIATWQAPAEALLTGVALHPREPSTLLLLDRRSTDQSFLHQLTFTGTALTPARGSPATVNIGRSDTVGEIGLTAGHDPQTGAVLIAVTDASQQRVVELESRGYGWRVVRSLTQPLETFGEFSSLAAPVDVAYREQNNQLQLFVVDAGNRVLRLR